MSHAISALLLPLTALVLAAPAAADVDTSDWLCESCPFADGYRAAYAAGATQVSDDNARFGNASGYDEEGTYANLDGDGSYAKDDYRLSWRISNLGLSSRQITINAQTGDTLGAYLGYREMPYRRFATSVTPYVNTTDSTLQLPGDWVAAGTTQAMPTLDESLRPADIKSDRKILSLGGRWTPVSLFRFHADYKQEKRDGMRISSGSSFTNATLLPRYFDYETDQVDAGMQWRSDNAAISVNYYGSFFSNNRQAVRWQTPFTTSPGAEILQKAEVPDNDFQQVAVNGLFRVTTWDSVIAFSAASGHGEQNATLLPYTVNPNIASGALPRTSADSEVDTTNYAITLTSRPLPQGRIRLMYRYDERDNTTLESEWNRVIVDLFTSGESEQNPAYGFERTRLGLSGDLVVWNDIRLSAGYDHKTLKRDQQEVAEQTVDAGWGQLRWQALPWLDIRVKGGAEERDIDRYNTDVAVALGQNPLLRKYNLAYRYRSYGELDFGIAPLASRWSLGASVLYADDRYNQSQLGITDSEELRITADLSIAFSEHVTAYLMLGFEDIDAQQSGSEQFSTADWFADHSDEFQHIGAGAHWRIPDSNFDFLVDYNRGDGDTDIRMNSLSGGQSDLPALSSTLDSLRIEAGYAFNERLRGTLDVRLESFELSDWALVGVDTLPTILTLGAEPYDYDIWAIGLGLRYSFGHSAVTLAD